LKAERNSQRINPVANGLNKIQSIQKRSFVYAHPLKQHTYSLMVLTSKMGVFDRSGGGKTNGFMVSYAIA